MPSGTHLRPVVTAARTHLAQGRQRLKLQHDRGSPGVQVCAGLTDLFDTIVLDIYEAAQQELDKESARLLAKHTALVPVAGYGRRDVAPYSDLDLTLLCSASVASRIKPLARRLMVDLGDTGLMLGFNVRTPAEACQDAMQDPTVFTSLVESRYLGGSVSLYTKFISRFRRQVRRRSRSLLASVVLARREERAQYGETVFLLEPNIKHSRGGLREIQLVRWLGFARYGEAGPKALQRVGALSKEDQQKLRSTREFLLRLRNEMHFHADKAMDVLDRTEQVRLAELFEYEGDKNLLPVEMFMREYFTRTSEVRNVAAHFSASVRPRLGVVSALAPLLSHQVERDFRVGPVHISATKRGMEKLRGDLAQVLRLMDLANLYGKRIDHPTWEMIRTEMMAQETVEISDDAVQRFLSLLSQPGQLGVFLRRLHELRVLEKIIPGFAHARCLLQFNDYHKFTVDEHSIRAVESATDFFVEDSPLGRIYRGIRQKRTLHLALLIHDLGKGFSEDHSEVGLRVATETAGLLRLPLRETETLKFLVHKHLMMSHLAFRRDTSDESLIVRFAVEVGSPEILQMLFVLTCADLAAVGPGVLNQWKLEVLYELYQRTMRHLSADSPAPDVTEKVRSLRKKLLEKTASLEAAPWFERQINALSPAYLLSTPSRRAIDELERLRLLEPQGAIAWGRYLKDRQVVEFTIGANEHAVSGIFHRLTGALSSQGMQILAAEISTLADGLVLDRFYVHDGDYAGQTPAERLISVSRKLVESLDSNRESPPTFRRLWKSQAEQSQASLSKLPTRVRVDNNTSEQFTVLDIFAHDRRGLLYTITRTLFELGVSVSVAKIGTYLDQVVDVFYTTDQQGNKIEDEQRLDEIRNRLLEAIAENEEIPPST